MKLPFAIVPLLLVPALLFSTPATPVPTVGISQIVEHPSLLEIRISMEATLRAHFKEKIAFQYRNANGNLTLSKQIAGQLVGEAPQVLVGISTPSTQDLMATKTKLPIVFTGVNDPIRAGFLTHLEKPDKNLTGVMIQSPVKEQVALIQEMVPTAKKIGMLYTAGEVNSVSVAEIFQREVRARQLTPVCKTVTSSAGVYATAQTLLQEVDAVLLPTDNTVISALGVVLNLGKKYHKPIFASDTDSVSQGAWAALGVDHRVLGQKTGEIVIQLLEGKKPQDIAVVIPMDNELHINRTNEKAYGVTAPQAVLTKARKVYPE